MKLIIQIPAFNEEANIEKTLRELPRHINGIDKIEVLVIDDGSSDRTVEAARRGGADHVVQLLSHRGLATAFVTGLDAAIRHGADIIVNTDADNQYKAADIEKLVSPIVARRADVVIGDRDVRNSAFMSPLKRMLQRFGSRAVGVASGLDVKDATSGFRAFSREAAYQLNVFNPFTYTLETIIQAGNRNLQVESVKIGTNAPTRSSRLYSGITTYIRKSMVTIFRIYTLYKPLKTFFAIGAVLFTAGVLLGLRFVYFYARGGGNGHIQSLILAAVLLLAGFQTVLIGLLADLISVNRRLSEEVLIRLRKLDSGGRPRRDERRPERERRPHPRVSEQKTAEVAAKIEEPQWVWLADEKKEGDAPQPAKPAPSSNNKRRRRRRPERKPTREPHLHRDHDKPTE